MYERCARVLMDIQYNMVYTSMCVGTCDFVYLVWTILIGSDGYLEAVAPSESGYHGVDVE